MTDKTVSAEVDPVRSGPASLATESAAPTATGATVQPSEESHSGTPTAEGTVGAASGPANIGAQLAVWGGTWWGRYSVRILSVVLLITLWHLASTNEVRLLLNFENVPEPSVVGAVLLELLSTDMFYRHIGASVERVAIAFALATVSGVALGVFMGRIRLVEDVFYPYVEIFRPIPAVAWIPLAILMLPTEQSSIIFITFLGAFFPIVLNTMHGVEQTPKDLIRAARALGASSTSILIHVVLPAALPEHRSGHGHRYGHRVVLTAGGRNHQRSLRHRLLHLELVLADSVSADHRRNGHDWDVGNPVHSAGALRDAAIPALAALGPQ